MGQNNPDTRELGSPKTVGELAALLATLPPNLPLFVKGYEGGFQEPGMVYIEALYQRDKRPGLEGNFEQLSQWLSLNDGENRPQREKVIGLVLDRYNRDDTWDNY